LPAKDNRGQDIVEKRTLPRVVELELLTVRLLPATVFVLAGITKLVDRPGSSTGLAGFGLSPKLAGTLPTAFGGRARGWCRADSGLACRVRLLRAIVLLSAFIVGISVTLARGRRPDCRCFGQFDSAPVGWRTLFRAGLTSARAAWLVFRGRLGIGPSHREQIAVAHDTERRIFIVAACGLCFLFFRGMKNRLSPSRLNQRALVCMATIRRPNEFVQPGLVCRSDRWRRASSFPTLPVKNGR
jgi:uncharacterized membrane protein YphA (DoxX/SURF4 family)